MTFAVDAVAYDRFMGRYSAPLAVRFADFAAVAPGQRALDVGSGPGALTNELVKRLGPAAVTAVDPSESFVSAGRERQPPEQMSVPAHCAFVGTRKVANGVSLVGARPNVGLSGPGRALLGWKRKLVHRIP